MRVSVDGVRVPTLVGLLVADKDPTEVGTLTPLARRFQYFNTLSLLITPTSRTYWTAVGNRGQVDAKLQRVA